MKMVKQVLGDSLFWQTRKPLAPKEWGRVLLLAAAVASLTMRQLLTSGYQFVGNDLDLPALWIWRFRFSRLWKAVGVDPWWNPYFQLGTNHGQGPAHPDSLLTGLQVIFSSSEKGLDYSLFALALVFAVSSVALLLRLGFSPLASLLGGLLLSNTGTAATQLFAGHVALYSCLCLTPALMLALTEGLARSRIQALCPAALVAALLLMCGEAYGPSISLWTCNAFFVLRALLGSPREIPAPTVSNNIVGCLRQEGGQLLAPLPIQTRLRECAWTLLKLTLVYLLAGLLSNTVWSTSIASGRLWTPVENNIFASNAPPLVWLSVLVPHLYLGAGQSYNWTGWAQWEGQPGMGCSSAVVILLGLAMHRRRDLALPAALFVLASLLALGTYTPIYGLCARLDPLIGHVGVASRLYFAVNFATAILFAWGLDALMVHRWSLSAPIANVVQKVLGGLALLWLASYFLDGQFELWQLFLENAQSTGTNYAGQPVDPGSFYALTWTRFTAACCLVGLIGYSFLRLSRPWRPGFLILLILLDITRFSYPYMNLRASQDFQAPGELFNIIHDKSLTGKLVNNFQERAVAIYSLLRIGEWSPRLAPLTQNSNLLVESARKAFPDISLDHPGPFNRLLGIHLYVQPRTWLDDPKIRPLYANDTSYSTEEATWALTVDEASRPPVYISRLKMSARTPFEMLQEIRQDPRKLSDNWTFVSPALFRQLDNAIKRRSWTRVAVEDRLKIVAEDPAHVDLECQLKAPGLVILNQAWSPEWSVQVDEINYPCLPCQLEYNRGVLVDGGLHRIRFLYEPREELDARRRSWIALVCTLLVLAFSFGVDYLKGMIASIHADE